MLWKNKTVLVTGGASLIGSHLVDHLVEKGVPVVRVVDDLRVAEKLTFRTTWMPGASSWARWTKGGSPKKRDQSRNRA